MTTILLVDLSQNYLSGTIPEIIQTLTELRSLYLNNNKLNGTVSQNIKHVEQLKTFLYQQKIELSLVLLTLDFFSLRYNR